MYTTFHDSNGNRILVKQSSSAEEPKAWIFCDDGGQGDAPHLTVDQAKMVRAALDQFIIEATQ